MGCHDAKPPSFIAIDLETTGLDPVSDRIIEIGAVKVVEGVEAGRFHKLVNPGREVPLRIQRLTGADPDELARAQNLAQTLPDLLNFLGAFPLVAHNAQFDSGFLEAELSRANAQVLENPLWDSLELARLVLPVTKGHSLAALANLFGIDAGRHHRALDDAVSLYRVFLRLFEEIPSMGSDVCGAILGLMGEGWLLAPLLEIGLAAPACMQVAPPRWDPLESAKTARPLDISQHRALFDPGGAMERVFRSYEARPGQVEMVEEVLLSFNESRITLIQAGTGTGKSMAYLIPAASWALENGHRVVVSTHTITLQEQLLTKDLPQVERVLGAKIRASVLKGRSNYVCRRKLDEFLKGTLAMSNDERCFASYLTSWLSRTVTGDRSEVSLGGLEQNLWHLVGADDEGCPPRGCSHKDSCFVRMARANARGSHVTLVNHSLLLADLKAGNRVIPPYDYLVVDEAHHLDQVATNHLGCDVSIRFLTKSLGVLVKGDRVGRGGFRGLEARCLKALGGAEWAAALLDEARHHLQEAFSSVGTLGGLLEDFAREGQGDPDEPYSIILRLERETLCRGSWPSLKEEGERLANHLLATSRASSAVVDALDGVSDDLGAELAGRASLFQHWSRDLAFIVSPIEPDWVYWIECSTSGASLKAAPLQVGGILKENLFEHLKCCVMTSATLTVGSSFDYFLNGVGLSEERVVARDVRSPFCYDNQVYLAVASDMPKPSEPDYDEACVEFLRDLGQTIRGRTLALFTSHRMLKSVASSLRPALEGQGIALLVQGVDGSRTGILEEFRANPASVLMGSLSFWEGVDVPGDALSAVVVVRLPFTPPNRPVPMARRERLEALGMNSFSRLTLPEAVIRLKQGFGRLVRTSRDRGVVLILDPRAAPGGSSYWGYLIGSLPRALFYSGSRTAILDAVEAFLDGSGPVPTEEVSDCWYF